MHPESHLPHRRRTDPGLRHRAVRKSICLILPRPEPGPAADGAGVASHHLCLHPFLGRRAAERHSGHLLHMVHRLCAGKGVGRFPLQPLLPAGDGGHGAGLSRHRHPRRHLLPVAVAAAGFRHALPRGAGAAVLRHPGKGEVFRPLRRCHVAVQLPDCRVVV